MKRMVLLVIALLALMTLFAPAVFAELKLDDIYFDPAIVASGDEVDIVIQYHDEQSPLDEDRVGDSRYTFEVSIVPDDALAEQYVLIQDARGDDVQGRIYGGQHYNKVFRVKVLPNAPAGSYQFKMIGQWYRDGVALDTQRSVRFFMPVKREGIILDVATIETQPAEVRPGDDFVQVTTYVENVGEKDAKSVEITLIVPGGFEASYADDNRMWAGRINAGERKEVTFHLDVGEDMQSGAYDLSFDMAYMDLDNNRYLKTVGLPFRVKPRPHLEVVETRGEGVAGRTTQLVVVVANTGEESAEAVDVRLIKQSSQPFTFDVRSDYVGELEPGEQGEAIFDIHTLGEADLKSHDFNVLIRAAGDSDEGDDNIYTFSRRASFPVNSRAVNWWLWSGVGLAIVVLFVILVRMSASTRRKRK